MISGPAYCQLLATYPDVLIVREPISFSDFLFYLEMRLAYCPLLIK